MYRPSCIAEHGHSRSQIHFSLWCGCWAMLLPSLTPSAHSSDGPVLSAEEKAAGFQLLFNGRDLTGWEHNGQPGTFEVKDGVLVGLRDRERGTAYWLSTKEQYGDFELRLQYRIEPRGNSGIFIRAPREGRASKKGMEIQIRDDAGSPGAPSNGNTASIYQVVPPRTFASRPAGEWNDLWILCDGDRVRVRLNGKITTDANMSDYEELKNRPRSGYIGLSAHTKFVRFRNVRLRTIKK